MAELFRKTANAKLSDVQGRGPTRLVTSLFANATDGAWVGGTLVLTQDELSFTANAMNRAVHRGTLNVSYPLDRIISASVIGGFGTKIIEVKLSGNETFEFRCNGAKEVLVTLEAALR